MPPSFYGLTNQRQYSAAAGMGGGKRKHPVKAVLAGGIAGALEISITYPTEYVKTRLHLQTEGGKKKFNGPIDCVRKTVAKHGPTGLYRGIASLLYGSIPKVASRFFAYEGLRNALADENGYMSPTKTLFAGMCAGATEAVIAVAPMETIKVKFVHDQTSKNPEFKSFWHGVRLIIQRDGFRGIYQGLSSTVLKQASNQAIRFSIYNPLKSHFQGGDSSKDIGIIRTGICGVIAGAGSVFGNTPIDVVKTRMQGLDARTKYKSTGDCVKQLWVEGGPTLTGKLRVFYKGTTPRLGRVCADVALVFIIYEQVMKVLDAIYPTPEY